MLTKIVRIEKDATCSLTGKKGECFVLQTESGEEQFVITNRVLELLRWNASIAPNGAAKGARDTSPPPPKAAGEPLK